MNETLFESPWLSLHRINHWFYVNRPNSSASVGILAITPEDEILLVEQFRIPLDRRVIEIPAGLVGDEEEFRGQSIAETAKRELLEETGYQASQVEELIVSPTSSGLTDEYTHLYLAGGLERRHDGGGVGGEDIQIHRVPRASIRRWLKEKQDEGVCVDFKIHAALWCAGL